MRTWQVQGTKVGFSEVGVRHAKFEGWLISQAENEATRDEWAKLGIVTRSRAKRMTDVQFLSELWVVVLENKQLGFDQDVLDELYAKYEDIGELTGEINEDELLARFDSVKTVLLQIEEANGAVASLAKGFGNFYTLWALVALTGNLPPPAVLAERYSEFMGKVKALGEQEDLQAYLQQHQQEDLSHALTYHGNSQGATTELPQRTARLAALRAGLGLA